MTDPDADPRPTDQPDTAAADSVRPAVDATLQADDHMAPAPAGSGYRQRRRRDWIIAGVLVLLVGAAGGTVYLTSDIRAVTNDVGPDYTPARGLTSVPQRLAVAWEQPTDTSVGAVGSVYGTVVTTDQHAVVGRDVQTGAVRWTYSRSNRELCQIGSGDTSIDGNLAQPFSQASDGHPTGILAVYARHGLCQELVLLNPKTGERRYQRTSPNQPAGEFIFGGPYAGWVSADRAEVWRWDLFRTLQYGDQPNPPEASTEHLGCAITDAALTEQLLGTVEHCADQGPNARLVLQWTDPHDKNKDNSVFKHPPLADVDTGSPVARLVGITKDRAAVLVTAPTSAVIVYDKAGKVVDRFPVQIPAADVVDTIDGGLTPRVEVDEGQYALVGGHLLSLGSKDVTVTVPVSTSGTTKAEDDSGGAGLFPRVSSTGTATKPATKTETNDSPVLRWTLGGAIGLPAGAGRSLLVPTTDGIAIVPAAEGVIERTIALTRTGSPQRVDLCVVGDRVVELRGSAVAVLLQR